MTGAGRAAVFDCFSGISGDMALAALVDAGASLEAVRVGLARLQLPGVELRAEPVARAGLQALRLEVLPSEERTYQPDEMRDRIRRAALGPRVEAWALAAVGHLEMAEAIAHGGRPRFHEVGGVDAMVDIVGTMLALESLSVTGCYCPTVTVGAATVVKSAHGAIPAAPGPAAAQILQAGGFMLRFVPADHELVTPTGAAILAAVAQPGPAAIVIEAQGAGAGKHDPPGRPNAVRVFVGALEAGARPDTTPAPAHPGGPGRTVVLLEANLDDMPAAYISHALERLMAEGALDAWTEAIGMKKGRAATKLCALARAGDETRLAEVFFAETSTLGVRTLAYGRFELERSLESRETAFGAVKVKVARRAGRATVEPEFEDVKRIAAEAGLPAFAVYRALLAELGGQPPHGRD